MIGSGPDSADAVVLGGGIAGLVAAWELTRSGRRPLLLEAGNSLGGSVARHQVAGLELDAGAESFATATGSVAALIDDLGMSNRIVDPNPTGAWVLHEAGAAPLPTGGLLGIPAHPLRGDVRRVVGIAGSLRAGCDGLLPSGVGAANATLGGLVRRRMGRRVVRRLVEPVAGGVYSSDPDGLELASVNPGLARELRRAGSLAAAVRNLRVGSARPGSAAQGLIGGMYEVVIALRDAVVAGGGQIRTGVSADSLQFTGERWSIRGRNLDVVSYRVVLAVPAPELGRLAATWPVLPPSPRMSDIALVTLVVRSSALNTFPRGTGVLVSTHAPGVQAKALTHATAKWFWLAEQAGPNVHVLRLSYGRGDSAHRSEVPSSDRAAQQGLADAGFLLGVPVSADQLLGSARVQWTTVLPTPGSAAAAAQFRAALPPGLVVVGSVVAGTGLAAVVADTRRALTVLPR